MVLLSCSYADEEDPRERMAREAVNGYSAEAPFVNRRVDAESIRATRGVHGGGEMTSASGAKPKPYRRLNGLKVEIPPSKGHGGIPLPAQEARPYPMGSE